MVTTVLLVTTGFASACLLLHWGKVLYRRFVPPPSVQVHFSPKGGCGERVVEAIDTARRQVLVMAYSFTFDPIVKALMDAHDRGVDVEILFDKSNETEIRSDMPRCLEKGMKVLVDAEHAIAHNKVMIIDQRVIVTGSFNFTRQAEDANAENLLILRHHPELVQKYLQYFDNHKVHCRKPQIKPATNTHEHGRRAA